MIDLAKLTSQALEFNSNALQTLRSPGVYMYVRKDRAVYVGASRSSVGRALSRNHHKKQGLLVGTSLLLFPTKTYEDAKKLEDQLIFELRPELNQRGGWNTLAKLMGYSGAGPAAFAYKR